jgi:hypothetical protein
MRKKRIVKQISARRDRPITANIAPIIAGSSAIITEKDRREFRILRLHF